MSIKYYIYIAIGVVILALAGYAYNLYQDYQQLKLEKQITEQNKLALEDSLKTKADSIVVLTSFVRDLNSENNRIKGQNTAYRTRIQALIDSIHAWGDAYAELTDSTVKVSFADKKLIASYKGQTLYKFKENKGSYELDIAFDPVNVGSELFEDENGIWKVRTTSLTPGIKVLGISEIDSETFKRLQNCPPIEPLRIFGVNMMANSDQVYAGLTVRTFSDWFINFDYRLNQQDPSWYNNVLVGVHYFIF